MFARVRSVWLDGAVGSTKAIMAAALHSNDTSVHDNWAMTVTKTQLERPAIFDDFGLSFDDVFKPTQVSADRVVGPDGKIEVVATRTYDEVSDPDDLVGWLCGTVGFPRGAARALVVQLSENSRRQAQGLIGRRRIGELTVCTARPRG